MSGGVTLALSTSSISGSIAIAIDGSARYSETIDKGMVHGREIVRRVERAFGDLSLSPDQIELVACDIGPGSFTGMRVGVTTAKTLAYACGARAVGVLSVDCMARNLPLDAGTRTVLIDAKRHEVYATTYEPQEGELRCVRPIEIIRCDEVIATLSAGQHVLGDGVATLAGEDLRAAGIQAADESVWYPTAEDVLALGIEQAASGETVDPETLLPYYLRSSEPILRKPKRV